MVVIDQSSRAKHAMMWALTHVANKGDRLALLHVVPHGGGAEADAPNLATLQALCRACKPEVEVEALVIQGPKLATVLSQCINKAECLTLAVRKQSKGVGGYLISTRWQKDFWLLA
ncbi:Universal stress protein [Musa troglodytarum]|nr:Universal stress protein [Musa troglodytarum]